jgi:regulator of chromosome condensation
VYNWGTFRNNTGIFGMKGAEDACLAVPKLVPELKNVISIASGSNHFVAVTFEGMFFYLIS